MERPSCRRGTLRSQTQVTAEAVVKVARDLVRLSSPAIIPKRRMPITRSKTAALHSTSIEDQVKVNTTVPTRKVKTFLCERASSPAATRRKLLSRTSLLAKKRRKSIPHLVTTNKQPSEGSPRALHRIRWVTRGGSPRHMRNSRVVIAPSRVRSPYGNRRAVPLKEVPAWENQALHSLKQAVCDEDVGAIKQLSEEFPQFIKGAAGESALIECARTGAVRPLIALITVGVKPDTPCDHNAWNNDGYSPLHAAVHHGQLRIIDALIKEGAYIDSQTHAGLTPLHLAALHDRADCCVALLSAGADPSAEEKFARTPLALAQAHGCSAACNVLTNFWDHGLPTALPKSEINRGLSLRK